MKSATLALLFFLSATAAPAQTGTFGKFIGTVRTEWTGPRTMRLLDAFSYVDETGAVWGAPRDSFVDGASIPQVFWTIIGGPFEGDYRNASVVHDVACVLKNRPWRDVHKMFYDAMRCGGVPEKKAKVMYFAVFHFGPRWTLGGTPLERKGDLPTKEGAQEIAKWVEKNNPTLVEIEKNRGAK